MLSIRMQEYKIICVPNVVSNFELPFHKLIELVHVHIHEELAGEIAEWESDFSTIHTEAVDDLLEQPQRTLISDPFAEDIHQNFVIDICEELPNVAFEYPCCACVIARNLAGKLSKPVHCTVRALVFPAGI